MNAIARTTCCMAALLLAACATRPEPAEPAEPVAPVAREVGFACSNGETLRVRFTDAPAQAVLLRGGSEVVLAQQPSGSGFIYGAGPTVIRGKGDALTVEIGRMVPLQCTAVR